MGHPPRRGVPGSGVTSPPDSVDSREEYEGGHEAMLEKEKKQTSVSVVTTTDELYRSILRRKSLRSSGIQWGSICRPR